VLLSPPASAVPCPGGPEDGHGPRRAGDPEPAHPLLVERLLTVSTQRPGHAAAVSSRPPMSSRISIGAVVYTIVTLMPMTLLADLTLSFMRGERP